MLYHCAKTVQPRVKVLSVQTLSENVKAAEKEEGKLSESRSLETLNHNGNSRAWFSSLKIVMQSQNILTTAEHISFFFLPFRLFSLSDGSVSHKGELSGVDTVYHCHMRLYHIVPYRTGG